MKLFKYLKRNKFIIYVASNGNKNVVRQFLINLKLIGYMDDFISSEDIENPKPDPEIYLKIMKLTNIKPTETLIIEDSSVGIKAAKDSGGHVHIINSHLDVNKKNIKKTIRDNNNE